MAHTLAQEMRTIYSEIHKKKWLVRGLCDLTGTTDLGHQLQLCGNSHQLAHGSAGSALQQPVTQAGEAEVQARGKGTPQESHCSYQWPGKTTCSVQMVS